MQNLSLKSQEQKTARQLLLSYTQQKRKCYCLQLLKAHDLLNGAYTFEIPLEARMNTQGKKTQINIREPVVILKICSVATSQSSNELFCFHFRLQNVCKSHSLQFVKCTHDQDCNTFKNRYRN